MAWVRTNIVIEDSHVQEIMRRYPLWAKTETIDLVLGRLAGEPMTREEAPAMHGAHAIGEIAPDSLCRTVG
ncbi:MAG TPA: type II toxin-antitoxin system VapB family antitoxin [Chloroflexota bacterium]|nr:type II toxin-antitoxin system VapB family antitoxin [Chloroflexota bacterium]